ncbi:hypothetical protein scyTo_0025494, partial [Scyliorhinus torazame]|nr:hypothetical protein [Scyliorhinus torazame]
MRTGTEPVREYLFSVNLKLNILNNSEQDVNYVVPLDIIKSDDLFYKYMLQSNE